MSVAPEFPPAVFIPERARQVRSSAAFPAAVPAPPTRRPQLRLVQPEEACQPPAGSPSAAGSVRPRTTALRLTRRGMVAVAAGVIAAGGLLLLIAHLSLGSSAARPAVTPAAVVTVQPGDTLWSIAGQVAPGRDPRLVIERIRRSNHLDSVALTPGQTLKVG